MNKIIYIYIYTPNKQSRVFYCSIIPPCMNTNGHMWYIQTSLHSKRALRSFTSNVKEHRTMGFVLIERIIHPVALFIGLLWWWWWWWWWWYRCIGSIKVTLVFMKCADYFDYYIIIGDDYIMWFIGREFIKVFLVFMLCRDFQNKFILYLKYIKLTFTTIIMLDQLLDYY